jgi:hypothetical protein
VLCFKNLLGSVEPLEHAVFELYIQPEFLFDSASDSLAIVALWQELLTQHRWCNKAVQLLLAHTPSLVIRIYLEVFFTFTSARAAVAALAHLQGHARAQMLFAHARPHGFISQDSCFKHQPEL